MKNAGFMCMSGISGRLVTNLLTVAGPVFFLL
jgi:hypothetical protein